MRIRYGKKCEPLAYYKRRNKGWYLVRLDKGPVTAVECEGIQHENLDDFDTAEQLQPHPELCRLLKIWILLREATIGGFTEEGLDAGFEAAEDLKIFINDYCEEKGL